MKTSIKELEKKAKNNLNNSYSPYSKYKVSCSLLSNNNKTYLGVNVENASFGATICAERSAIMNAVSNEGPNFKIKDLVVVCSSSKNTPPCAQCLQVINEFSDKDTTITFYYKNTRTTKNINELLPFRFQSSNLKI